MTPAHIVHRLIRRLSRLGSAALIAGAAAVATVHAADGASTARPNVLFILGDNLGRDWFGCYGSDEACTPEIDKLAATGVRFTHCYVTPLCSTTRVELLTGRYGFRTGWHTHHDAAIYGGGNFDPRRETTVARLFQSAGYATTIAGKWQISDLYEQPDALARCGFDEHLVWTGALKGDGAAEARWQASRKLPGGEQARTFESRYADPVVFHDGVRREIAGRFGPDVYVDHLIDFMTRRRDRPFFAYYATPLVHVPVVPVPGGPAVDAPQREQFAAMVKYFDGQVGRLVEALNRLGLRERTIVVVMTDNGTPKTLGGMVDGTRVVGGLGTLRENGLDVPLVVNCPGRVPVGRVAERLVDGSDLLPTLCETAGIATAAGLQPDGRSFSDALGELPASAPPRDWIFAQYADERVVRDARYKLFSTGALFDLTADPAEERDLSRDETPDVVAARRRLQAVLDGLPPNADPGFEPRSSSAFKLRAAQK